MEILERWSCLAPGIGARDLLLVLFYSLRKDLTGNTSTGQASPLLRTRSLREANLDVRLMLEDVAAG
jgi:hypothetical protein